MTNTNQSRSVELKPCPWCGRQPKTSDYRETSDETGEVEGYAAVECNHGGPAFGGVFFHCETLDAAIEAWNTRALSGGSETVGADDLDTTAAAIREIYFAFTGQPHGTWSELGRPEVTDGEAIREKWREIVRMARGGVS